MKKAKFNEELFKEALEKYKTRELSQKEAADKCGVARSTFELYAKKAGVKVSVYGVMTYTDENGNLVRVEPKGKHGENKTDTSKYGLYPSELILIRQRKKLMNKFHSNKIEQILAEAKKLGLSYGKYVAMKKMGVI